jgi:predicted kinase
MNTWTFPFLPTPPDWRVDWDAIAGRFLWIQALAGVPQEPTYHAEGDVLVHTRLVVEALAALDAWRALELNARSLLFAAALLHDVAKPQCTRRAPDGRIISPGHARVGASLAHYLLWTGVGLETAVDFPWRETVARLVRHHGLPLWFFAKADPQRAVIAASQTARLDHIAILAEADVRGRHCTSKQELLDRIALLRVFGDELGCLTVPYPFASDHSRFRYFMAASDSNSDASPDPRRAAYDDTRCEVVLLSGLPGAGKDTWIASHRPDWPVVSLDAIRRELRVPPNGEQGAVVHEAKARARELLRRRQSFVWNATNVTRVLRTQLIALFAAYQARVAIVYLDAARDVLLARNRTRPHPVPEAVIDRLARRLEVPDLTEAHTVTWVYQ